MIPNKNFTIYLKKSSRKGIVWSGLLLHILSIPFFVNELFETQFLPMLCIGPILVALLIAVLKLKFHSSTHLVFILNYLLMGATWFAMPYFKFFGILFLVLAWFDRKQLQPQSVEIGEKIAFKNNLTKKEIDWNQLDNLILKHQLLTIDFKNNKLLQLDIDPELTKISVEQFNEFCQSKLTPST